MPLVTIVLPTYKEAENLEPLVRELESLAPAFHRDFHMDLQVLVVDDNSQDGTGELVERLSGTFPNIKLVERPKKLGLGSALRLGLKQALATYSRYVVTMDADGSHDPQDLPRLMAGIMLETEPGFSENGESGGLDLVQASRYMPGGGITGMPMIRRLSSRLVNSIYHWCAGGAKDCTNNFRVLSRRAAEVVVERSKGQHYEFVPEAILLVLAAGMRVAEVPSTFKVRKSGSSKFGAKQKLKGLTSLLSVSFQHRFALGRFSRRPLKVDISS